MPKADPVPSDFLTTRQIAERCGVTPRTVTYWWQAGLHDFPDPDLPGTSNRWHRWHRKTIDKWMNRHGGKG